MMSKTHSGKHAMRYIRSGFTLVELLVVIAIIGILMALALPAIQSVRESGRRTQCSNNLTNIAKAFVQYEAIHRHLPTGGWGVGWGGDADRGFGRNQPGGWAYNILPYIEENTLHDIGKGMAYADKKNASEQRVITPVTIYNCPSRRRSEALPFHHPYFNITSTKRIAARADYAVNAGNQGWTATNTPSNEGCSKWWGGPPESFAQKTMKEVDATFPNGSPAVSNGISFIRSELSSAAIRDGMSKTYCVGERYVNAAEYESGTERADNQSWEVGYDPDMFRCTTEPPLYDLNKNPDINVINTFFGGPHTVGFMMSFCDGSTRMISYEVDPFAHSVSGNRSDGQTFYSGGVGTTYSLPE
jgi:prepilin-type N-terminal cleavage/methylation domain-containing protein